VSDWGKNKWKYIPRHRGLGGHTSRVASGYRKRKRKSFVKEERVPSGEMGPFDQGGGRRRLEVNH